MKTGYSILLGELINSEKVDYEDCKYYQIVCPECFEPVFKVNKSTDENSIHYLAHYKGSKTKEEVEECELRVKSINRSSFDSKKSETRAQHLKFFLKVFENMLNTCINDTHKNTGKVLKKSKGYRYFESEIRKTIVSIKSDKKVFESIAINVIEGLKSEGNPIKSSFRIEKQKDIAWDLLRLLLTPKSKVNLRLLVRFSFSNTLSVFYASKNIHNQKLGSIETMLSLVEKIAFSDKKGSKEAIMIMGRSKISGKKTYLQQFNISFKEQLVRNLLMLPYFEFLKNGDFRQSEI